MAKWTARIRTSVPDSDVSYAIGIVEEMMQKRLAKHGPGGYSGPHESLGIIAEEYHELVDAVRSNDHAQVEAELIDVAVACVFAIASKRAIERTV